MKIRKPSAFNVVPIAFCIGFATVHNGCDEAVQHFPVTTLESGTNSGKVEQELRLLVISRPTAFEEIYGEIASLILPRPTIPVIDFTKNLVVIALMGEKPTAGYGIRFAESTRQSGLTIEVQVLRTTPADDAILSQVITRPYVIAIIARDHYTEIVFVDELGTVLAKVDIER